MDRDVFLIQTGLNALGFGPLVTDGDLGPKTASALSAFDAQRSISIGVSQVAQRMVALAVGQRGVRETSKNQGPGIEKYWSATPHPEYYDQRAPYCAAFVCWSMREALDEEKVPQGFKRFSSPVAYEVEAWARSMKGKGVLLLDASAEILPGDIITLSVASHVVIATSRSKGPSTPSKAIPTAAAVGRATGFIHATDRAPTSAKSSASPSDATRTHHPRKRPRQSVASIHRERCGHHHEHASSSGKLAADHFASCCDLVHGRPHLEGPSEKRLSNVRPTQAVEATRREA